MLLSNKSKDAMLKGLSDAIDAGVATMTLYEGYISLAVLPLTNPCQSSIHSGKLTFSTIEQALVNQSGLPDTAVIMVDGVAMITLTIGIDLILSKPDLQAGGYLKINELTLTI